MASYSIYGQCIQLPRNGVPRTYNSQHTRAHTRASTTALTMACISRYSRGCHGSWLSISVSSRCRRAAASRTPVHMLGRLCNGHFSYFTDSSRRRQHLTSNFGTISAGCQSERRCATVHGYCSRRHTRRLITVAHATEKEWGGGEKENLYVDYDEQQQLG